jgi:hypothetical protein
MDRNRLLHNSIQLAFTNGGTLLNLKAEQGGNQKGLCFVSTEVPEIENGVYEIKDNQRRIIADVRKSEKVPKGAIFLDRRIFSMLSCISGAEISIAPLRTDVDTCKTLELEVTSVKGLDNRAISEAISKSISDLSDDFEGLVLYEGQRFVVAHLGIWFTVRSLVPVNGVGGPCRIKWDELEKIHLQPTESVPPFNLICLIEVGAAAFISDVLPSSSTKETMHVSRFSNALRILDHLASHYSAYGQEAQFSGFIYSDEVEAYSIFDPETGNPVETTSLYSKSIMDSFIAWADKASQKHKDKPSNPGLALATAIERASDISKEHTFQTIILLCSSGIQSCGPNPVKTVKNKINLVNAPVICISIGSGSNIDILRAIADVTHGLLVEISAADQNASIDGLLAEWFRRRI